MTTINLCKFLLKSNALTKKQVLCLQHLFRFFTTKEFSDAFSLLAYTNLDILRFLGISIEYLVDFLENCNTGILSNFIDCDYDISTQFKICVMANNLQPFFNYNSTKVNTKNAYALDSFSIKKRNFRYCHFTS